MRTAFAIAMLVELLPGQVVTITNTSGFHWRGWKRVAVQTAPPHTCGWDKATDVHYFAGDGFVDVQCSLAAGQSRTIDLATIALVRMPHPQFPADPEVHFGGFLTNLTITSFERSGAGFRLVADELTLVWYPTQAGWCGATPTPSSPVLTYEFLPFFGDAAVWMDPRPVTFVWWRHLRDLPSALADCMVVAQ
jgi:hypothetical protein